MTTTEEEKEAIQKLKKQFVLKHNYFGPIWKKITHEEKYNVLEIIASGKGIISYKKNSILR